MWLPLLLLACGTPEPACPGGWDRVDDTCVARLPDGTGVPGDGAPEPLAPGDLTDAAKRALAERFQPAMVFAGDQIWPVSVTYCAESGADLMRHPPGDDDHSQGVVAADNADIATLDFATLPDGFEYQLDCPGDNTGPGWDDATWLTEWARIQGDDPATAPYPPVHYAHLAWFDRAAGLLLVQYWFFLPYDKYTNNHEGDWEHVNVVVDAAGPTLVDVHFSFHSSSMRRFERVTRLTDDAGGDHVVVFSGGCSDLGGWGGCYSGASWPWPGRYDIVLVEDTTPQLRTLHPRDIDLILLPERDAIAPGGPVEVSWASRLTWFGQWEVAANHPLILSQGANQVPTPPPYKGSWGQPGDDAWEGQPDSEFEWFEPPADWDVLYNPGADDTVRPPAPR